ncbi:MAG: hypothetical protein E7I40_03230 [Finegoldia magna]|uniref:hypothetical protein n=1 Tax=Finegoldia magna TaxID=1260 RepID=UPI002912FFAE|nr:hypothetical protein [Finegoldia magna]MDU4333957.1 hypothetical protein [Finegoldia magna]
MSEYEIYEITRNYASAIGVFLIASIINLIYLTRKNNEKKPKLSLIAFSISLIYASIMMNFTITLLRDGNFNGNEVLSNIILFGTCLLIIITIISIILSIRNEKKR